MAQPTSTGVCSLCGATVGKRGMAAHIKACREKACALHQPSGAKARKARIFHIAAAGRYQPDYWIHLDVIAKAPLEELDRFLRDIWLECCGHLSCFSIEGKRYMSSGPQDDDEGMDAALGDVLEPGMEFLHKYDFGSSTELALKVVSLREAARPDEAVTLLARNNPPEIICACGKLATQICQQCLDTASGCLCDECARKHKCGDEMFLPIVNSPRVGVCGYTGRR